MEDEYEAVNWQDLPGFKNLAGLKGISGQ